MLRRQMQKGYESWIKRGSPWFWLTERDYMLGRLWGRYSATLTYQVAGIIIQKHFLSTYFALDTPLVTGERDKEIICVHKKIIGG